MDAKDKLNSTGYYVTGEDCPNFIKLVYSELKPKSLLDVGCGPCKSFNYFKQHGIQRMVAIDGSAELLKHPQVQPHLKDFMLVNLEGSPVVLGEKFDLVWSYEVAEHIANEDNYILTLTENAGDYIVMTAAPPGQAGIHHVNCQPREHWIEKITARGFKYMPELVSKFCEGPRDQYDYMTTSGMVFKRLKAGDPVVPAKPKAAPKPAPKVEPAPAPVEPPDEWGKEPAKERGRGLPIRFHLLGLAHLPTRWEYTPCAYTWKILRLARMLKSRGHEIIFYGNERSEVECDKFEPVSTEKLRIATYGDYDWKKSANFIYTSGDVVHQEFNRNAIKAAKRNWQHKDILLCSMGLHHKPIADALGGILAVESGIGYEGIFSKYKVFESYAWMHYLYGKYGTNDGNNYDCVIPNYYDSKDFPIACQKPSEPYLLHVSRMIERKGIRTSVAVAKACGMKLIVAGQGDIKPFLGADDKHVEHVGVVEGQQKAKLFGEATALLMPTVYIGPFEGVNVESQLCGVPVLTTDWGCFAETVEQGKTGYRCRTLREFVQGVKHIVAGDLNPEYIRGRAMAKYDMVPVSIMYERYFYNLLDLYGDGWYALD